MEPPGSGQEQVLELGPTLPLGKVVADLQDARAIGPVVERPPLREEEQVRRRAGGPVVLGEAPHELEQLLAIRAVVFLVDEGELQP
jgi:hypothetical protein